jgi:hypothetical protein
LGSQDIFGTKRLVAAACAVECPHAVEKAAGDRERAIKNVCRLYGVNRLDALPPGIRPTTLALLGPHV